MPNDHDAYRPAEIAALIETGMVRKLICSFPRSSDPRAFTDRYLAGEIEQFHCVSLEFRRVICTPALAERH